MIGHGKSKYITVHSFHGALGTCRGLPWWHWPWCLLALDKGQCGFYYKIIWGLVCQKQVSRARTSNYIPQYLWDVITCPCPWYLILAHKSYIGTYWKDFCMQISVAWRLLQINIILLLETASISNFPVIMKWSGGLLNCHHRLMIMGTYGKIYLLWR